MGQTGCWTRLLLLMGVEEGEDATGLSDLTLGGLSMKFHLGGKAPWLPTLELRRGTRAALIPQYSDLEPSIDQHYTWTFVALKFVKVVLLPLHWRLC